MRSPDHVIRPTEVVMPGTGLPFSAGEHAVRTDLAGMAAEVRHRHVLKCFEMNNIMAFVVRITEAALGRVRVTDLCAAKVSPPSRQVNEVQPAAGSIIPAEFVCAGPVGPRA